MKTLTKCFYNIVTCFSTLRREGDNGTPSPLSKGGHVLAHYVIRSSDTFSQFLGSLWCGEVVW